MLLRREEFDLEADGIYFGGKREEARNILSIIQSTKISCLRLDELQT